MKSNESPAGEMSFERVGDSWQIAVRTADDLFHVRELDAALWAMTSLPIESVSCDPEFLAFMDDDNNGRIRVDEAKRAISWLLGALKDYSGVNASSDVLKFSAINDETPEGKMLLRSAKLAMENTGTEEPSEISLADIRDRKKIMAAGLQNGDGVIPPSLIPDPDTAEFAFCAMNCVGKVTDVSGLDGIDLDILTRFSDLLEAYLQWRDEPLQNPEILPYGEATKGIFALYTELAPKIDEFFTFCGILRMSAGSTTRAFPALDVMDSAALGKYLASAPLLEPNEKGTLLLKSALNPLYAEKVTAFFRSTFPEQSEISEEEWRNVKTKLAVFDAWLKRKNTTCLDALPPDRLQYFRTADMRARIAGMIEFDAERKDEIACFKDVRKLILYQRHMLEFMNNYVSLKSLFNQDITSMLLAGKLVMDGRHFTLTTRVSNVASHKKLAVNSNICTMYVDVSTGPVGAVRKMTLAVAVTSGDMYSLFIGKSGVFVTPDGVTWDAQVIDYIQQPVSFSEALKMPFFRFGAFIGKQIDKFFSARSKEFETGFEKSVAQAQSYDPQKAPEAVKQQTPAVSGSMLLMGGGVGLAAIGSSIAFMAQALHNISLWNVIGVLLCVILIFGGPVVVISLVKLYRRNVAGFLEAGGWALNKRLRLSRKMGLIFTNQPRIPVSTLLNPVDVVESFLKPARGIQAVVRMSAGKRVLLVFLALLLGIAAGLLIWHCFLSGLPLFQCGK